MDKVQIYELSLIMIGLFFAGLMHGQPKEGEHNAFVYLISLLLSLPVIGRIFNWW